MESSSGRRGCGGWIGAAPTPLVHGWASMSAPVQSDSDFQSVKQLISIDAYMGAWLLAWSAVWFGFNHGLEKDRTGWSVKASVVRYHYSDPSFLS